MSKITFMERIEELKGMRAAILINADADPEIRPAAVDWLSGEIADMERSADRMTRLPKPLRFRSCHNLMELVRLSNSVRAIDMYWRQFVRMADRLNDESSAG